MELPTEFWGKFNLGQSLEMSKSETRQPELSPLSNGIYLAKLVRTRAGSKGEASELERLLAKATDVIFLAVSQLCQSLHTKGPVAWIITTLSFIQVGHTDLATPCTRTHFLNVLFGLLGQLLAFPLSHAPNLIWANEGTSSGFSAIFGYFILAPTSLRTDGAVKLSLVATVGCQAVFVLAFTSIIASQMYGSMKMSKSVQKV